MILEERALARAYDRPDCLDGILPDQRRAVVADVTVDVRLTGLEHRGVVPHVLQQVVSLLAAGKLLPLLTVKQPHFVVIQTSHRDVGAQGVHKATATARLVLSDDVKALFFNQLTAAVQHAAFVIFRWWQVAAQAGHLAIRDMYRFTMLCVRRQKEDPNLRPHREGIKC